MRRTILDTPEDIQWLKETHLKAGNVDYHTARHGAGYFEVRCAILFGNEDSPSRIETYASANPDLGDFGIAYTLQEDGRYKEQAANCIA